MLLSDRIRASPPFISAQTYSTKTDPGGGRGGATPANSL